MSNPDARAARTAAIVDQVIRGRHTTKLMLSLDLRDPSTNRWTDAQRHDLETIIEGAAWAPFHRRADEETHRTGELRSPLPWRFHVLEGQACNDVIDYLESQARRHPDSKWSRAWQSKVKNMLAACGALIQVTWLPDPYDARASSRGVEPAMTLNNIEHIAAASAAVQNVLLAAEARGWKSYWSSGGILRDPDLFALLGIGAEESLLGSVFLGPAVPSGATGKPGGLREDRGSVDEWVRWVERTNATLPR